MSIKAIGWAFDQKVPPTTKLVLLKLADNANDDGWCWPSQSTLAKHTGLSRKSISRHIKNLSDAGLIEVKHRQRDGVSLPNHYLLNLRGVGSESHRGGVRESLGVGSESHTEPSVEPSLKLEGANAPPAPTPENIKEAYNRLCPSLKTCRGLSEQRKRRINQLRKTLLPTMEIWEAYFEDCEDDDFCAGRVPPGKGYDEPHRADLDFVLRDSTVTRMLER